MQVEELHHIAEQHKSEVAAMEHRLFVCMGTACKSSGSDRIKEALETEVKTRGFAKHCSVESGGCQGLCAAGPMVQVEPQAVLYKQVQVEDTPAIVDSLNKKPITRLVLSKDTPFFKYQRNVVLDHGGILDPESIEAYIAAGGYEAAITAITEKSPAEIIAEVTRSGLRGRGGAGYPTGLKWSTVAKAVGTQKYVICNGDEGDPGAFMDRSLMEDNPHRIIEGMLLAAYAVGASEGFLYVRAEYPLAVKRLQTAIKQAQKLALLGNNICGTPFNFNVSVRLGAGAFVCGEETALIASIEGRRGQPRPRPPYPAEEGLWGCPTLINNAETYGNIVPIIRNGGDWFSQIGTEKSKGTKVFALTGNVKNTGLIEVPFGITLREIVYEIGGGIPNGRRFKAVQTGGPGGGCIPEQYLDMPVDYESLASIGSFMGSGGMIVMDDATCMVKIARYFMEFCMEESCGKCIPCRVGTAHMHALLTKICEGEASLDDLELLESLCDMVKNTSLCGLGGGAPNPVLTTLRYFREEYLAHIVDKTCPAGVCAMHTHKEMMA